MDFSCCFQRPSARSTTVQSQSVTLQATRRLRHQAIRKKQNQKSSKTKTNHVNLPLSLYSVSPVQVRVHHHSAFTMPSPKHRCSYLVFKLDISANQNWDSTGGKKNQPAFIFILGTCFFSIPGQRQPQGS